MTKKIYAALAVLFVILVASGAAETKQFPSFSTIDLYEKIVTNDIFAENQVTMINFWATWCPPCVAEMPDLGELAETLQDSDGERGLIGILIDADESGAIQKAGQILSKAKARFTQLRPSEEMYSILSSISAIPTSIFVDSKGNIVGPTIVGARSKNDYLRAMTVALTEARK